MYSVNGNTDPLCLPYLQSRQQIALQHLQQESLDGSFVPLHIDEPIGSCGNCVIFFYMSQEIAVLEYYTPTT